MKLTKKFTFSTPIAGFKDVIGYARIEGLGYWQSTNDEYDPELTDFDIECVTLLIDGKEEAATLAYRICHENNDDFAEQIDTATLAHQEYLFFGESGTLADIDHTDTVQNERPYQVVSISDKLLPNEKAA